MQDRIMELSKVRRLDIRKIPKHRKKQDRMINMVETEDIKVWKFDDGTYEQHYYLDNGCISKCSISKEEYEKYLYLYGGGDGGKK